MVLLSTVVCPGPHPGPVRDTVPDRDRGLRPRLRDLVRGARIVAPGPAPPTRGRGSAVRGEPRGHGGSRDRRLPGLRRSSPPAEPAGRGLPLPLAWAVAVRSGASLGTDRAEAEGAR